MIIKPTFKGSSMVEKLIGIGCQMGHSEELGYTISYLYAVSWGCLVMSLFCASVL